MDIPMGTYGIIFNETIELFNLKASDLASESGVGTNQVSRFRNGKTDLQTASLEKLIDAMPKNAKAYFYSRLMVAA